LSISKVSVTIVRGNVHQLLNRIDHH
jgi:hypothetical protein